MESSLVHPLAFFDQYLEEQIFLDWEKFKTELISEYGSDILEINNSSHSVCVQSFHMLEFSFEDHVKRKIKPEVQLSRNLIEHRFQTVELEKEVLSLSRFFKLKTEKIFSLPALNEFKFLGLYLNPIRETINSFGKHPLPASNTNLTFILTANSGEERIKKAEKLYQLLTEQPAFIDADKEDFVNAFTGKDAGRGIRWIVKGKNKYYNKKALIFFLKELIDASHLPRQTLLNFNTITTNVFRDNEGQYLKNFRQSKSGIEHGVLPMGHETLKNIISQL